MRRRLYSLILTVPKGSQPIYYAHDVPYVRHITSSRPAQPHEVIELIQGIVRPRVQVTATESIEETPDRRTQFLASLMRDLAPVIIFGEELEHRAFDPWLELMRAQFGNVASRLREAAADQTAVDEKLEVQLLDTAEALDHFAKLRLHLGSDLSVTELPIREMVFRIVRCAHALLYGAWLPNATPNSVHVPVPEVDQANGNRPKMHLSQTYSFADALCTAQKTHTYDAIVAYGRRFKYVTTWTHADGGEPMCFFALDIYELHRLGIFVQDFPKAVIGSYRSPTPPHATVLTSLKIDNSDDEILYPILI